MGSSQYALTEWARLRHDKRKARTWRASSSHLAAQQPRVGNGALPHRQDHRAAVIDAGNELADIAEVRARKLLRQLAYCDKRWCRHGSSLSTSRHRNCFLRKTPVRFFFIKVTRRQSLHGGRKRERRLKTTGTKVKSESLSSGMSVRRNGGHLATTHRSAFRARTIFRASDLFLCRMEVDQRSRIRHAYQYLSRIAPKKRTRPADTFPQSRFWRETASRAQVRTRWRVSAQGR